MGRHRLFTARHSGKPYGRISSTGQLYYVPHFSIWLTPKSQLVEPWVIHIYGGSPLYVIDGPGKPHE